ncbi:MAG: hypothetical protein ACFFD4_24855 [Candidatus Odinarchaeota archaeon]
MAEAKTTEKGKKKPKYQIITEKVAPHVTIDFKTGKRDPDDFKALLRRLHDLKELDRSELKYALTNYRLIVLSLGLFHFLPEITENEDKLELLFSQIVQILQEKHLSSGKVRTKEEFLNDLVAKLKAEIIAFPMAATFTADISSSFEFLRKQINETVESSGEDLDTAFTIVIPKLLNNFRENMLASGKYSPILYDMSKVTRNVKGGELRDAGTLLGKVDEWERRYTSPEEFREEPERVEKPTEISKFREARPALKSATEAKKEEEARTSQVGQLFKATSDADIYEIFTMLRKAVNSALGQTNISVNEILKTSIPKILNDFKENMVSQGLISRLIIYDIDSTSRKFSGGTLDTKDQLFEKLSEWEVKCRGG